MERLLLLPVFRLLCDVSVYGLLISLKASQPLFVSHFHELSVTLSRQPSVVK